MNRILRLLNQREDAIQTALPKRDLQSRTRSEAEGTDRGNVG
jgi:hypothetical protein